MSERLLEALMQLFALLTDVKQSEAGVGRAKVRAFLALQFTPEHVRQYVQRYDHYFESFHRPLAEGDVEAERRQSLDNAVKMESICHDLNQESDLVEKTMILVIMLNYVCRPDITGAEESFVDSLADHLRVPPLDYWALKTFALDAPLAVVDKARLLLVNGTPEKRHPDIKHIYVDKFGVNAWFLHLRATNSFVFRYDGARNLYENGHKIDQGKIALMSPGAVLNTSNSAPIYYGHISEKFIARAAVGRIVYKAEDIECRFDPQTIGLHRFNFLGKSGQLVGIMGGSGTGKSTLMNLLCGRLPLSAGQITINGYDIHADRDKLRGVIGYVPQDDMLNEELTVYENLWYNARLVFSNQSAADKQALVEKALQEFDLVETRDLKVGSPLNKVLSGGQRKRLNIALELMREPSVLFVDEPTSGLSSSDSENVMMLLKRQVLKGKLVVINIHQPSSDLYKLLDKLLIIDRGGYVVYNGNPMNAIVYFKTKAGYVNAGERECYHCGNVKTEQPLRIIEARTVDPSGNLARRRKVSPAEWYELYLRDIEANFDWTKKRHRQQEPLPDNLYSPPSWLSQLVTYIQRDALKKLKDLQYMLLYILEVPILALLLAFATHYIPPSGQYSLAENSNLPTYLFMCVIVAIFVGLNLAAEEMIKDRKLLLREQFLNLSRGAYLSAKILNLFAMALFHTAMLILIGHWLTGLSEMWLQHGIVLFACFAFAIVLGLNISSGLKNAVSIYVSIPLVIVPQLLFSGTMVSFERLHPLLTNPDYTPFLGDLMVSRWGYEALAVETYERNAYERRYWPLDVEKSQAAYASAVWMPELARLNDHCLRLSRQGGNAQEEGRTGALIVVELRKAIKELGEPMPDSLLVPVQYDVERHDAVAGCIEWLRARYSERYNRAQAACDSVTGVLCRAKGGPQGVADFKARHTNEALERLVLAKDDFRQIDRRDDRLVRRRQPIFITPDNPYGRAHLYAPVKRLGNWQIRTVWFNTIVIWLFVAALMLTLYFDVLRRLFARFETLRGHRLYKKIEKLRQ